jgi:hypothetical protein
MEGYATNAGRPFRRTCRGTSVRRACWPWACRAAQAAPSQQRKPIAVGISARSRKHRLPSGIWRDGVSLEQRMNDSDWNDFMAAQQPGNPEGRRAMNRLCRDYWRPIYLHIRKSGALREAAEELSQRFFVRLFQKKRLRRGRTTFRAYLLRMLKRFLGSSRSRA